MNALCIAIAAIFPISCVVLLIAAEIEARREYRKLVSDIEAMRHGESLFPTDRNLKEMA